MKTITTSILLILLCKFSDCQTVAFQADRMNVLYIGVDNPITIVAENTDCSKIKLTPKNVILSGRDCKYVARVESQGTASITVTYKVKGKERNTIMAFRVKHLPPPIFKIGTGQRRMQLAALKAQQYVRADFENFDYDFRFTIDSFAVCAFAKDTCVFKEAKNFGNKISDEVKDLFNKLKPGDTIIFKNIYAKRPDEESVYVEPALIIVY